MDDISLDSTDLEKDLGINIASNLCWKTYIYYLCSKANRMLGIVQRTCNFIRDTSQKRVLYMSLVLSPFNHCSQVWRPNSTFLFNKLERVQVRGIKWILSEQNTTYSKIQYFDKCEELDLLPIKARLDVFSIRLFHRIIHRTVYIKLPKYIIRVPLTTLRSSHRDPLMFESLIKPRFIKRPTIKQKKVKKIPR